MVVLHESALITNSKIGRLEIYYDGKEFVVHRIDGKKYPKFKGVAPSLVDQYLAGMDKDQLSMFVQWQKGKIVVDMVGCGHYTLRAHFPGMPIESYDNKRLSL